jgi:hypothetical protein
MRRQATIFADRPRLPPRAKVPESSDAIAALRAHSLRYRRQRTMRDLARHARSQPRKPLAA